MTDPLELRDLAVRVAVEAAALVRARRAEGVAVVATKSSAVDIVTETDRESEELIRAALRAARPHDGFVGEEGGSAETTSGVTWVVDPIDGTVNFLYGVPAYAVSIAARTEREVVAGAVVNVANGEVFSASRGGGAFLDGTRLQVRPSPPVDQRLVATGFWYDAQFRAAQGAAVARLLPLVRDIRRGGSCALDLCSVAAGRCDAYVEEGPAPWDYAAGGLVAEEAGARLELRPGANGQTCVICAPADGFAEFAALVEGAGFLERERGE
ncbi:MAG TPA: inositol monophosphatase family protein [Nocardioidaceae bacterium]|nr:inositol monophosphatase family protein [Nocardioidaceae bacterium]